MNQKVIKVNPIVIPKRLSEQGGSLMSDIEIPSISFDEMDFVDCDFSTNTDDHLLDDSSGPLCPGATITMFQATSILTSWFSLFPGISKSAFDRLLNILRMHILPVGNNLPESYSSAHKSLSHFLTPVKVYHCCVNDCVVYRNSTSGKYADLDRCPKCKEPRYKDSNGKIPRKRFNHLLLELRIRRLFGHKTTSQLLQQHSESTNKTLASLSSIHESKAWEEWFGPNGISKGKNREWHLVSVLMGSTLIQRNI